METPGIRPDHNLKSLRKVTALQRISIRCKTASKKWGILAIRHAFVKLGMRVLTGYLPVVLHRFNLFFYFPFD